MSVLTAGQLIARLGLQPHPEGGHYVETFRDAPGPDGRARSTAIYFLLRAGQRSHWHKVDAAEMWFWHAGSALTLSIAQDGKVENITLGADLALGQRPQAVVPPGAWQEAESWGEFTLVSCVVAPGFEFSGFTLAPEGWRP